MDVSEGQVRVDQHERSKDQHERSKDQHDITVCALAIFKNVSTTKDAIHVQFLPKVRECPHSTLVEAVNKKN